MSNVELSKPRPSNDGVASRAVESIASLGVVDRSLENGDILLKPGMLSGKPRLPAAR